MKKWLLIAILAVTAIAGCDNSTEMPRSESAQQATGNTVETDVSAGKYKILESPLPSEELGASKPYVVEFFWFGCPHCYNLEPLVKAFRQSHPDIQFITLPAAPNPRWEIEARIYYAMEAQVSATVTMTRFSSCMRTVVTRNATRP